MTIKELEELVPLTQLAGDKSRRECPCCGNGRAQLDMVVRANNYHCFRCNVGGGVFNWLVDVERLSNKQAYARLMELAGKYKLEK